MPHTMLHPMGPLSMPPPSGGSRMSLRAAPLELPHVHVNSIAATHRAAAGARRPQHWLRCSRHARRPVRRAAEATLSAGAGSEGSQHSA
eukprot:6413142-Prymnesium_polylepis.1